MDHARFIHQTTQMHFIHCEAAGFVHVNHKRPSWCLLPLHSVTDSVQEGRRLRLLCSPPRTEARSHDVTLSPFMSATGSREELLEAYRLVFLNFLHEMCAFGCIALKLDFKIFNGLRCALSYTAHFLHLIIS